MRINTRAKLIELAHTTGQMLRYSKTNFYAKNKNIKNNP